MSTTTALNTSDELSSFKDEIDNITRRILSEVDAREDKVAFACDTMMRTFDSEWRKTVFESVRTQTNAVLSAGVCEQSLRRAGQLMQQFFSAGAGSVRSYEDTFAVSASLADASRPTPMEIDDYSQAAVPATADINVAKRATRKSRKMSLAEEVSGTWMSDCDKDGDNQGDHNNEHDEDDDHSPSDEDRDNYEHDDDDEEEDQDDDNANNCAKKPSAMKRGRNEPEDFSEVGKAAQLQEIADCDPAPKKKGKAKAKKTPKKDVDVAELHDKILNEARNALNDPQLGELDLYNAYVSNDATSEEIAQQIFKLDRNLNKLSLHSYIVLGRHIQEYTKKGGKRSALCDKMKCKDRALKYYISVFEFAAMYPMVVLYRGTLTSLRDKFVSLDKHIKQQQTENDWLVPEASHHRATVHNLLGM